MLLQISPVTMMAYIIPHDGLYFISGWWFGTKCHVSIQLGISSSQLTKSYFSEGLLNHQPDIYHRLSYGDDGAGHGLHYDHDDVSGGGQNP